VEAQTEDPRYPSWETASQRWRE
jgi:hypothetical protein